MAEACFVCGNPATALTKGQNYEAHQGCSRCGEFWVSSSQTAAMKKALFSDGQVKVTAWITEQNELGEMPELTIEQISAITSRPLPSVLERINALLFKIAGKHRKLGEKFSLNDEKLLAHTYCHDRPEFDQLVRFLRVEGLLELIEAEALYRITPKGHLRADDLTAKKTASDQGFVAMAFDPSLREAYDLGIDAAIRDAGYKPFRVDRSDHTNKIDDEIILQIRRSRFVVADFTLQRGGVYFEAGFASGLNLPIFWTCRADDIKNLHFDVRQFNCINWTAPAELADRLHKRIEAILGRGPNPS